MLDELALYHRALGASEIVSHYNNGLVGIGIGGGAGLPGAPTITSAAPPATGAVGTPYSFTVTATGTTPITFTASSLPTGLTISSAGELRGGPECASRWYPTL